MILEHIAYAAPHVTSGTQQYILNYASGSSRYYLFIYDYIDNITFLFLIVLISCI